MILKAENIRWDELQQAVIGHGLSHLVLGGAGISQVMQGMVE